MLARKMALSEPCGQLVYKKLLYEMLCEAARGGERSYVSGSSRERLLPAAEYIADHCDRSMSNDILVRLTGYSTVHFRKLFTELYGMSPMAYVRQLRIEKAKAALGSDYGTIGAIAQALGYASIYDFSRAFKCSTGFSPSAYARREEYVFIKRGRRTLKDSLQHPPPVCVLLFIAPCKSRSGRWLRAASPRAAAASRPARRSTPRPRAACARPSSPPAPRAAIPHRTACRTRTAEAD